MEQHWELAVHLWPAAPQHTKLVQVWPTAHCVDVVQRRHTPPLHQPLKVPPEHVVPLVSLVEHVPAAEQSGCAHAAM